VSVLYTITPRKDSADFATIFRPTLPSEGKFVYIITTVMLYHKLPSFLGFRLIYLFNNFRFKKDEMGGARRTNGGEEECI
jgi:hypothetical protein